MMQNIFLISSFCLVASVEPMVEEVTFSNSVVQAINNLPISLSRFSNYSDIPDKVGLNKEFWLKGVDFSCASPWNDSYGFLRAGTAISRRHIVFAKHFPLSKGTRIAFVGDFGSKSYYQIVATAASPNCDIMIGLLDYELTPDVHPAKILPIDCGKWMPVGSKWPVITLNQREQAILSELSCSTNKRTGKFVMVNGYPTNKTWAKLCTGTSVGDSGSPAFLIYKMKPILLYCLKLGGQGHGPKIHEWQQEVQKLMNDLCPGYKLNVFDFKVEE